MGKKNKKEKKGLGKEKTQQKAEKKANKRQKKELAEKGEDDIEKLIAEFQEKDKKKTQVIEEKCAPPSPRCNMTLTAHPDRDELIMFGGEYFTGNKMFMYNDLMVYNIKKNEWLKITAPNSAPPRSAHQAVALRQGGGQLWIFGGEFASPTQSQFYHYKDLWLFHLKDKMWEKVSAPGGPSARSGHRMVQCKKQLIVFGGFHDNIRDYKYFNDVYAFNLDTYTWVQIAASGNAPNPRSGCILACLPELGRVLVYGGYSKERVKKELDQGKYHTDMTMLVPEGKVKDDVQPVKWKWVNVKQSGSRPSPRSGFSLAAIGNNRAICFGGVFDEEENEEQLKGKFYNNLCLLELDKGKWFDAELRGKRSGEKRKRRKKAADGTTDDADDNEEGEDIDSGAESDENQQDMDLDESGIQKLAIDTNTASGESDSTANSASNSNPTNATMDVTDDSTAVGGDVKNDTENDNVNSEENVTIDTNAMETEDSGVFKLSIGPQGVLGAEGGEAGDSVTIREPVFMPPPRMNTMLTVKNGHLFLYGGIFEVGDKQYTLSDMYSLDLNKMEEWRTLIECDLKSQVWEESDSSSDDDDDADGAMGGDSDSDDDEDDDMDIDFSDAPERNASEPIKDYYERSRDYWISKAKEYCDSESMTLSEKKLEKLAKEMCQEAFSS